MRLRSALSLVGLATLTFALAGAAAARQVARVASPSSTTALRTVIDHYRVVTWTFQRAAHEHRTPTSFSYRHSADPAYLQWTATTWEARAGHARADALARLRSSFAVALPRAPRPHSKLAVRLSYSRNLTLRLRRIYPGTVTRTFATARAKAGGAAALHLWEERSAVAALAVARHGVTVPAGLRADFSCIHRFEGAWTADTGNGYYGGLQMDLSFQRRYGAQYVRVWGTADKWPAWAQLAVAVRAYQSGRGFYPWPNTARACGLI